MAVTINASTTAGLVNTADTSGILQLQTANTTAVTVDASQNVTVVGSLTAAGLSGPHNGTVGATTAAAGNFTTLGATGATTLQGSRSGDALVNIYNTNNVSGDEALTLSLGTNTNNTSSYFLTCKTPAVANRLFIYGNGNVVNANNSYGALSDIKLKENIVDATPKLANLMQVKVRNYNLIGDTNKQLGVVAQELETVFPAMIDVSPDKDSEGNDLGTTTKSVKYSVFVPMLIKAIQEQQALITQLQADVATLKGTP